MAAMTVTCPLPPDAPEAWEWKVRSVPLSWAERRRRLEPALLNVDSASPARAHDLGMQSEPLEAPFAPGESKPRAAQVGPHSCLLVAVLMKNGFAGPQPREGWSTQGPARPCVTPGARSQQRQGQERRRAGTEPGPGSPASWKGHPALSDPGSLPRPVSHGPRGGGPLPNSLQTTADRVVPGLAAV